MIDVTVLFLDETYASTAVGPMEVFRHAGELYNLLTGKPQSPYFHVTTASADGRAVLCGIRRLLTFASGGGQQHEDRDKNRRDSTNVVTRFRNRSRNGIHSDSPFVSLEAG